MNPLFGNKTSVDLSKQQMTREKALQLHTRKGGTCRQYEGTWIWRSSDSRIHCDYWPAIERNDGSKEWVINGLHHRENGPAIETENYVIWCKHGHTHRVGGPAIIKSDKEEWFTNGQRHREDGPAVVYKTGKKIWYQNDLKHRTDGPAVEAANNIAEWWLDGKKMDYLKWQRCISSM